MYKKVFFIILIVIFLLSNCLIGQGCSDAGFCTINSFKPSENDSTTHYTNQIKLGGSYGQADNSIFIIAEYLEYNKIFNKKISADFKLTSISQSGNGISSFGLSDLFLNTNYSFSEKIKFTIGTKIPLNSANRKQNSLSLPMDYQSSLGTFDLILGFGYEIKKIQLVVAFQQPLTQNKNDFFADNYPMDSKLRKFQSTNKFKRSGDILLRISYPFTLGNKFKITPSILPIYHLTTDRYTNLLGIENEIKGSDGLTLNVNGYLDYNLSPKNALQLNIGVPLVVREKRPDGLTRSLIATIEYRTKF